MPSLSIHGRRFDARPDRIDYRDRKYQPALVSLPAQYPDDEFIVEKLPEYSEGLVLDQGREGACTGFGLAAVINYLLWKRALKDREAHASEVELVSARMLYQMARVYDEWPGEDYEGSSCRGAMKGWHRHGTCCDVLWPYRDRRERVRFQRPKKGWQDDAARRPLGAYYRVEKDSIADMQAAIHEVGALYVSAAVHDGWFLGESDEPPVIEMQDSEAGGHAFALVGYTSTGFIVQNSWGPRWGYHGFAILTYADWIHHGSDAWVAVLGAPMAVRNPSRTFSTSSLRDKADGKTAWFWRSDTILPEYVYDNQKVEPLGESEAYEHTVVLENDGRAVNRFLDVDGAAKAVEQSTHDLPLEWLSRKATPRLAIYAHGGLNKEQASIERIRVMAPYFLENDVYPLFITWRTGFRESLGSMLEDAVARFFAPPRESMERARGLLDDVKQRLKDAKDRSVELACQNMLVKPIWSQMKQNAGAASDRGAGLALVANHLGRLRRKLPKLQIHLVGHSAGSILHGHLLDRLAPRKLKVSTCTLYAPACTVGFAVDHYGKAFARRILAKPSTHVDLMSDERERADSLGPYGKSLLYLVSRALETVHKMPILGMEAAWDPQAAAPDLWNDGPAIKNALRDWRRISRGISLRVHDERRKEVSDGRGLIPLAHGSFDNDVEVVTRTLERIRGRKVKTKVESLRGF